jgi:hypothetical protein
MRDFPINACESLPYISFQFCSKLTGNLHFLTPKSTKMPFCVYFHTESIFWKLFFIENNPLHSDVTDVLKAESVTTNNSQYYY